MGNHSPLEHQIRDAIQTLKNADRSQLQQQAKTLFKQQLQTGFAARIASDFKEHEVDNILKQLDSTLEDRGLLSHLAHTVHCGSTYTALVTLEQCLAALQDSTAVGESYPSHEKDTTQQHTTQLPEHSADADSAPEPHATCRQLACEIQQLVQEYQEAERQLTSVGEQLRQARSGLKSVKMELEGPAPHAEYNRLAQASQDLKDVTQQLRQLQVEASTCSASNAESNQGSTCRTSSNEGAGCGGSTNVGRALQGIQQFLHCSQSTAASAVIVHEVLRAWQSSSCLQDQMAAAVLACAAHLPALASDLAAVSDMPQLQQVVCLLQDSADKLQQLTQHQPRRTASCRHIEYLLQQLANSLVDNNSESLTGPSDATQPAASAAPPDGAVGRATAEDNADISGCNELATVGSVGQPSTPCRRWGAACSGSRGPSRLARAAGAHSDYTVMSDSSSSSWERQVQHAAQLGGGIVDGIAPLDVSVVVSGEDLEGRDEAASPTHASQQPEPPSRLGAQSAPASSWQISAVAAQQQRPFDNCIDRRGGDSSNAFSAMSAADYSSSQPVQPTAGAVQACSAMAVPGEYEELPISADCQQALTAEAAQQSEERCLATCGTLSLPSFGDTAGLDEEDSSSLLHQSSTSEGSVACCSAPVQDTEQEQQQHHQSRDNLLVDAPATDEGSKGAASCRLDEQSLEQQQVEPVGLAGTADCTVNRSLLRGCLFASDPGDWARSGPVQSPSYLASLNMALQADSRNMRQQVDTLQQQLVVAKRQLEDSTVVRKQQQKQLELHQQMVKDLQQQLIQQRLELDAQLQKSAQVEELQHVLTQKQQQVDALQQQLSGLHDTLLCSRQLPELREQELASCKQQIEEMQQELIAACAARELQEQPGAQVVQLQPSSALHQEVVEAQQREAQLTQQEQQADVSRTRQQVQDEQQIVQLQLQVDTFHQQLCDALNEAAVLKMEQKLQQQELKMQLDKLQQVEQLQQQLAAAHAEVVQLTMQQQIETPSSAKQEQEHHPMQEAERLQQQVLELQRKLSDALCDAVALRQQQEVQQQEWQNKLAKLQDVQQLQQNLAEGEAEMAQPAGQYQFAHRNEQEQVVLLQQQVQQLQQELAAALADAAGVNSQQEQQQEQLAQLTGQQQIVGGSQQHTRESKLLHNQMQTEQEEQQLKEVVQNLQQQLADAQCATAAAINQQEQQAQQHAVSVANLQQQLQDALAAAASAQQQVLQTKEAEVHLLEMKQVEVLQQQLAAALQELEVQAELKHEEILTQQQSLAAVQAAAAASEKLQQETVEQLNQRVLDLQRQVQVAADGAVAAQQVHSDTLHQIQQLQQQLSAAQLQTTQLSHQSSTQVELLQQQLADAEAALSQSRQQHQQELDNVQQLAQKPQGELHPAQAKAADLQQQLEQQQQQQQCAQLRLQQHTEHLSKQLAAAQAEVAQLSQQKQSLQQQLATEIEQQQKQHENLLQQLADMQSSLDANAAQQQHVDVLQQQLSNVQQQLADALADAATWRQQCTSQQAEFDSQLSKLQIIEQLHMEFAAAQWDVANLTQKKRARQQQLEEQLSNQQQQIDALQQQLIIANAEVSMVAKQEQQNALALVAACNQTSSTEHPAAQQRALVTANQGLQGSEESRKVPKSTSSQNVRKLSAALTDAYMELAVRDQQLGELYQWMDVLRGGVSQVRQTLNGADDTSSGCAGAQNNCRRNADAANSERRLQEVTIGGVISSNEEAAADPDSCSALLVVPATPEAVADEVDLVASPAGVHQPHGFDQARDHMALLVELQMLAAEVKAVCWERQLLQEAVQHQLQAISGLETSLAALKQQQDAAQAAAEKLRREEFLQATAASVAAQQLAALMQQMHSDMPPAVRLHRQDHMQDPDEQQIQQQLFMQNNTQAADEQQQTRRQLLWSQETAMSAVALAAELSCLSAADTTASEASTVKETLIKQLAEEVQQLWSAHARAEQLQSQLAAAEELNISLKSDMSSIAAKLSKLQGSAEASNDVRKRRKSHRPASSVHSTAESAPVSKQPRSSSRAEELASKDQQIQELRKQHDQLQIEASAAEQLRQQLTALQLEYAALQQQLQAATASATCTSGASAVGLGVPAFICATLGRPADGVWGSEKGVLDEDNEQTNKALRQSVAGLQQQVAELESALQSAQCAAAANQVANEKAAAASAAAEHTMQQLKQQIIELQAALEAAEREVAFQHAAAEEASQKAAAATTMAAAADNAVAGTIRELQEQLEQVTMHLACITQQQQHKLSSKDAAEAAATAAAEIRQLRCEHEDLQQLLDYQKQQLQEQDAQLQSSRAEVQQLQQDVSARVQQLADQQVFIGQLRTTVLQLHQQLMALQQQQAYAQLPAVGTDGLMGAGAVCTSSTSGQQHEGQLLPQPCAIVPVRVHQAPAVLAAADITGQGSRQPAIAVTVASGSGVSTGALCNNTLVGEVLIGAAHARTEELRRLYRDLTSKDAHIQRLEARAKLKSAPGLLPGGQQQHMYNGGGTTIASSIHHDCK